MKQIPIGGGAFYASEMAMGCMGDCRIPFEEAEKLVLTAVEEGIDYFDHADVYGFGDSEEYFGRLHAPQLRCADGAGGGGGGL